MKFRKFAAAAFCWPPCWAPAGRRGGRALDRARLAQSAAAPPRRRQTGHRLVHFTDLHHKGNRDGRESGR